MTITFARPIGIIGAATGSGDNKTDTKAGSTKSSAPTVSASKKNDASGNSKPAKTKTVPVQITAKKTAFAKSILADGSSYTSVAITIANHSSKKLSVNPLYFAITDTHGTKHTAELGVDDKQIDTVDLAPGETSPAPSPARASSPPSTSPSRRTSSETRSAPTSPDNGAVK
ncbi:DUF4352 domain-containing protein [Streptomyces sp. NPDC040750]|uniref:DUF4352 domain-containing protein n=1 Tax=Streptomyces sp. NPDC040750 TaxID=3154491 RepID=UPI0033D4435B